MIYRVITGALFLGACLGKAAFLNTFINEITFYNIMPGEYSPYITILVLTLEFVIGLMLLIGTFKKPVAISGIVLLVIFMAAKTSVLMRGLDYANCNCFGTLLSLPLWASYAIGIIMIVLLLFAARIKEKPSTFSWSNVLYALKTGGKHVEKTENCKT